MSGKFKIDYQRMQVTANLMDPEPTILIISEGKVRCIEMFDHGHFIAKTHDGKITSWENTEKGKM
ncbi:hypothetical protein [Bacillus sp. FJAT-52991]|uniref:Uncharacterized protein n=1 Tax=Bacillus kandeliae TaxID=3129297 RepID=A0ABZ2NB63_9BACI